MSSPNATVYRFRSVGLILDDIARVGCCRGAGNVHSVRTGGRPAGTDAKGGAERPATDTDRERPAPASTGDAHRELLVVGGDRERALTDYYGT